MMNDFQITELAVKIAIALGLQYDPKNINLIETEIVDYLESQTMSKVAEWQKEKPNKPCLMVTRTYYDRYNYQLFELNCIEDYLAVICEDGEEWGALEDLTADEYFVIEYFDSNFSD